jgi:branched-chain amino acid transport system ATP-binding protein
LASEGIPIVLVEQNVHRAIGLVNRFYMLERGSVVLDGGANHADRSALMERLAV